MTVRTSAGTTLAVTASAPATYNEAGYAALAFTDVGEVTDLGEFGREYNLVTHNPLGTRGTRKFKGSFNEGSITLQLGLDNSDAGQTIMKAASKSDADYFFRVTLQNGEIYYFPAKVMSWKVGVGGVDQITSATATLEISSSDDGVGVVEKLI